MLVLDPKWDLEADVVIVGFGSSGAMAALTAAEAGANVVILEKQREGTGIELGTHYSTSHMSGGVYLQPTDYDATIKYFQAMSRVESGHGVMTIPEGWSGDDLIEAYTVEALHNKEWLDEHGFKLDKIGEGAEHNLPGVETFVSYRFENAGLGMMRRFEELIRDQPRIKVLYSSPATNLITNLQGEVIGIRAAQGETDPKPISIRANNGVLMAMGGFEFNEEMKMNYLKVYPTYFTGSEATTGDGFKMVAEVGAQLWHMNCASARLVAKFPEFPNAISLWMGGLRPTPYILVDKYGKRWTNEKIKGHTVYYETALFDSQKLDYPRIPSYWVFDKKRMTSAKLSGAGAGIQGAMGRYAWSSGNKAELERGWILEAPTIEALAEYLEMDPAVLAQTVKTWNQYCADGKDPEFDREESNLLPLEEGPFYAIQVWPGGPNTQGGARHNTRGEILDMNGNPIPGLYGSGEFGSLFGLLYPSAGGNLSECFAMGRVVGRVLARPREFAGSSK